MGYWNGGESGRLGQVDRVFALRYGELLYNGVQAQRVPLGAWPKVGDVQPEV